jgi:hypothetical protein
MIVKNDMCVTLLIYAEQKRDNYTNFVKFLLATYCDAEFDDCNALQNNKMEFFTSRLLVS